MILRTVPILFEAFGYDGKPAPGALARATLYDGDGYAPAFDTDASGLVVPPTVSATTDADGRAVLALWPNSRGVRGTKYLFELVRGTGYTDVQAMRAFGVVPDIIAPDPLPLPIILQAVPPPSVDDAQAAATAAQFSAAQAAASVQVIEDLIAGFDPDGGGGGIRLIAGANLSGHRAVRVQSGKAVYADGADATIAGLVAGITSGAALLGETVTVKEAGLMVEPSWNWIPDKPIFCGANGTLTQTPPTAGIAQIMGIPTSPTSIVVGVKQPFVIG